MNTKTCIYCGGHNIKKGINVAMSAEVNKIGLKYITLSVFRAVEPLYADLCEECGSVTRFWVKDTKRNWEAEPE